MLIRLCVYVSVLVASYLATRHFYYEAILVPKLSDWTQVPVVYWVGAIALESLVCIVVVVFAKSTKEWVLYCVYGGIAVATIQWTEAILHRPGSAKLIEGGILHFVLHSAFLILVLLVLLALVDLFGGHYTEAAT